MQFTDHQLEAIRHREGPCLVLAVPGAGKTTVLLERIHQLVESGLDPHTIASITFSRQQARDMEARYQKTYPKTPGLTFSTIHAFCYRILTNVAKSRGKRLELIEGSSRYNKYRMVSSLYRAKYQRAMKEEDLEEFFRIDGYLKNALLPYSKYKEESHQSLAHFEELSSAYEAQKQKLGLIDFDDMLLKTLQLLDQDQALLSSLQARFHYYQVDEAQDTSAVQLAIIRLLAEPKNNLLLVADDDQAIYGFRGADPSYLLDFRKFYPQAKIITMEDNYRSSRNIVRLSAGFIRKNVKRYDKAPLASFRSEEKTRVILSKDLHSQLGRIVEEAQKDLAEGDLAILFRNNASLAPLAQALQAKGLAFQNRADGHRFFRDRILSDFKDMLLFAQDPRDLSLFEGFYYKLNQYLKKAFIEEIRGGDQALSVWDRLRQLPGTQNAFYRERIDFLDQAFSLLPKLSIGRALEYLLQDVGYGLYLKEEDRKRRTGSSREDRILENLLEMAASGLPRSKTMGIRDWIQSLDQLEKSLEEAKENPAPLVLSTVHGAKGLEYDSVYVIDLIQGEFPSQKALEFARSGQKDLLEEERRLFYVAMTRARKKLRLFSRKRVYHSQAQPSQFIQELSGKKKSKEKPSS